MTTEPRTTYEITVEAADPRFLSPGYVWEVRGDGCLVATGETFSRKAARQQAERAARASVRRAGKTERYNYTPPPAP